MSFIVMAYRHAESIAGAAQRPCKGSDGTIMRFDTIEAAKAEADAQNERLTTRNVHYEAQKEIGLSENVGSIFSSTGARLHDHLKDL